MSKISELSNKNNKQDKEIELEDNELLKLTKSLKDNNGIIDKEELYKIRNLINNILDENVEKDDSTYLDKYNKIIENHDVEIKLTITFVRNFLKGIISKIKVKKKEKLPKSINLDNVIKNIYNSLPKTINNNDFYSYVADFLISKSSEHYYYDFLATFVEVERLHNITTESLLVTANLLQENLDKNNNESPILSDEIYNIIVKNSDRLQSAIKMDRDYDFDFFGLKTLQRSYLYKLHFTKYKIIERPQHMIMRVALGIHGEDINSAIETYEYISQKYFTHATPTLFNSGTRRPQMSSCFLQSIDDNIVSIFDAVRDMAYTSKWSGGIGVHLSSLRGRGSLIRGTNGTSSGIIPLCILLNKLAKYINQGGKRNGSIACFREGTEIFTANGGVKQIQDVEIGDMVVTHKNRLRPVTQLHKNPLGNRKIYKLEVQRNKDIYVTGNHKFWSFYTKKYKSKKLSLGWNSVDDLKEILENKETTRQACYISMPEANNIKDTGIYKIDIMDYSETIFNNGIHELVLNNDNVVTSVTKAIDRKGKPKVSKSHSVKRVWKITEDFANLIGMWLGDGHINKERADGKILGIVFSVHDVNNPEIDFIKKTCEDVFGCNITTFSPKDRNVVQIYVNSRIIGIVFMEMFGSYFDGKNLPDMVFGWPKKLVNSLIAGLITTDGHITKKKTNATIDLSNEKLVTQLYHLCRSNGIGTSFVKYNKSEGMTCDPYSMSVPLNKEIVRQLYKHYEDDRLDRCKQKLKDSEKSADDKFLKILKITETDKMDEFVYTLGVEEDHSYMVEGLLAENCYTEPWHSDIYDFVDLRLNNGNDDNRARDLFLALWTPSLFMERVRNDEMWSLMCPDECPNLNLVHSEEFNELYEKYEREGKYRKQVKARHLWKHILESQSETGFPYILYKDNANKKSNQQNLGTIRSSNLCAEIIEYSDENETAVCNLMSLCLPKFIEVDSKDRKKYNFQKLMKMVRIGVRNLDKIIDRNYYPTEKTRYSNMRHRPMGIGVQGLGDTYNIMGFPFDSDEAKDLNNRIFESIYYAAIDESKELAKIKGHYSSFFGSPFSEGKFQFHLWGISEDKLLMGYNWKKLIREVKQYGTRNSLLTALMPTASTSQIMGNSECIEPYMSNIFKRSTLAGEFIVVNKNLMKDLIKLDLWNEDMKKLLIINNGSIQNIDKIPDNIKRIYKTAFELSQKALVEQSSDRGKFIDQSQSFNIFMAEPNFDTLTAVLFDGHDRGNKTGIYYYRSLPAVNPINFGIDVDDIKRLTGNDKAVDMISKYV
jgi:ribonucleoside-diphosphate reductase alpha subunit